ENRLEDAPDEPTEVLPREADALKRAPAIEALEMRGYVGPRRLVAEATLDQTAVEAVRVGVEPPNDPEVDDADPPVPQEEAVPRGHDAVEHAVAEERQEPATKNLVKQGPRIDAEPLGTAEVVDGDAIEKIHGNDARAGEFREGLGDGDQVEALDG